jgi:hypothetical protein
MEAVGGLERRAEGHFVFRRNRTCKGQDAMNIRDQRERESDHASDEAYARR